MDQLTLRPGSSRTMRSFWSLQLVWAARGHYIQHAHSCLHTFELLSLWGRSIDLDLYSSTTKHSSSDCELFNFNSGHTLKFRWYIVMLKLWGLMFLQGLTALENFLKLGAHKYGKAKASMHTHALSHSHMHTHSFRLQAWLKPLSLSLAAGILYATQPSLLWVVANVSHIQISWQKC